MIYVCGICVVYVFRLYIYFLEIVWSLDINLGIIEYYLYKHLN